MNKNTHSVRDGNQRGTQSPAVTPAQRKAYRAVQEIKARYADGEPLSKPDRTLILTLLRQHPHGRAKFGVGVNAVVLGPYINNTRCFFVIRADGTAEDFSIRKCLGLPTGRRTPRVEAMMRAFRYGLIVQAYRFRVGLARSLRGGTR